AVDLRWVAEGIIPSPEQVLRSWYTWIFGSTKAMLSPYSGTWLDNVVYSTRRVLQGFGLSAILAIPLGLMIGWSRLAARLIDPTARTRALQPIACLAARGGDKGRRGRLAQLVERLLYTQDVGGS